MSSESDYDTGPDSDNEALGERFSSEGSGSEYVDEEDSSPELEGPERENEGPDTAEKEIENDFNRLVDGIRHQSGTNLLSKDWDISIQEKDSEFKDDLRGASGVGKRKVKRGRRRGPLLSHQVRAMIGEGNQSYVDGNLPETIRIMQEVIRIEPRAASAWSVIAQCYDDMKDTQKALQLRIMAAHLNHDAEEWERLALQSRELGYNQQALYCYRKVYSLDPDNVHALWDRAFLAKEVGDLRIARHSLLNILKRFPHDLTVLDELRPILVELNDLELCSTLFQEAFDHFQNTIPVPPVEPEGETQMFSLIHLLVLADLYNTLSVYDKAVHAIRKGYRWLQGRSNQKFWDLCEDDREWDVLQMYGANMESIPDDQVGAGWRKRDNTMPPGGYPLDVNARHRLGVARIRMGDIEEGRMHANVVLEQDVLDYAPLFVEIADAFFEQGRYEDARPIYEILGADAVTSSIYILKQTAICLRMNEDLKEAAEVYDQIRLADPSDNDVKMKLAEIYEIMNEPRKALELVHEVIASRRHAKRGPTAGPSSKQDAGTSTSLFDEKARSRPHKNKDKKLTATQVKAIEAERVKETSRGYARCKELWAQIEAKRAIISAAESRERDEETMDVASGNNRDPEKRDRPLDEMEREWLLEAEKLSDGFRETRSMFLSTKKKQTTTFKRRKNGRIEPTGDEEEDEDRMVDRLQLDMELGSIRRRQGDERAFRQIPYDDWIHFFLQYAFMLTRKDQYETADEVLRHLLLSSSFQSEDHQLNLRLALITISISAKRHASVVEHCRKLINVYQFNNEPMRLMFASLASGLAPTETFIASTLQKHIYREMKLSTKVVEDSSAARWHDPAKRWVTTMGTGKVKAEPGEDPDEDEDEGADDASMSNTTDKAPTFPLPTRNNPVIVAAYGQICNAAKSYQSALFYLLHAYDWCPEDPMVCLSLAIASIGRAMQRQADNRNHLITQGVAFLSQYRELRASFNSATGEVDFNFGRLFQQLGLFSLAVNHYEAVLKSAENLPPEKWGVAREAAYNLAMIYVMTGARPLAEHLYRRWLTI